MKALSHVVGKERLGFLRPVEIIRNRKGKDSMEDGDGPSTYRICPPDMRAFVEFPRFGAANQPRTALPS